MTTTESREAHGSLEDEVVPHRKRTKKFLMASASVVCLVAAAYVVADLAMDDGIPSEATGTMPVAADSILPTASLEDLVSYGDAVAVITVLGEQEGEPIAQGGGSYSIARSVDVVVDEVLWETPFPNRPILERGSELTLGSNGWWVSGGERLEIVVAPGDREIVGGSYVVALVHAGDDDVLGEGWQRMGPQVVLAIVDGEVKLPGAPLMEVSAVGRFLDRIPVPSAVESHRDLPPRDRMIEVVRARENSLGAEDPYATESGSRVGD